MKPSLRTLIVLAGGALALATRRKASRPVPVRERYPDARTRILVVGGGFGGLAAAEELSKALGADQEVAVGLVDRVNHTTFWPMVPAVVSGNIEMRHVAHSIRRVLNSLGAEFFQVEVKGINFGAREVITDAGVFPYDYLILAPGSRTAFFGTPGAREHAMDLKGLLDALRIRSQIIDRFEEAHRLRGEFTDDLLTFVFVGGGPTGVEGAAEAHDLIFDVLEDDYPGVDFRRVHILLVNAGDRILKVIDPSLAHAAERRLASRKIDVLNNAKVAEVRPGAVVLSDGRTLPARTTVWAAGVEPPPFVKALNLPKDAQGHILVDGFLRVKDRPGVYAVGDCARVEQDGSPVPALAQAAEQEGRLAARNIAAEIQGGYVRPFRYRSLGQLVDLGKESAIVDILGVKFAASLGSLVWKGVYLYELGRNLDRARVLSDWFLDLFARPDTSDLFEEYEKQTSNTTGSAGHET
jgi:NADH:ubiquinone reductase (H+-translocating)